MSSSRTTSISVGILFIVATAAPILSIPLLGPLNGPNALTYATQSPGQLAAAALLELVMAAAIVGIAVMMHPILRAQSERAALGYIGSRVIEGAIFVVVAVISLQLLHPLSRYFAEASASDASFFGGLGALLVSAHDQAYLVGGRFVFAFSALILNYSLHRSRGIPRWLSVWGLCGAALLLAGSVFGVLGLLGSGSVLETLSFLPIALQEMVFAVWLIAVGFSPSRIVGP